MCKEITVRQIGIIRSPYMSRDDVPRQAHLSDAVGEVEIFPDYEGGLKDIDGFSSMSTRILRPNSTS